MARKLKDWLQGYVEYTKYSEAPLSFHFWTGVSTIAAALQRRVWIDQGYFQWIPNFYIILVAPPGVATKSVTISIGTKMLRELNTIRFGPNVITWQALVQSLAASTEMFELDGEYITQSALHINASELGTFLNPQDREMVDILVDLWDGRAEPFRKVTKMSGTDIIHNPCLNIIAATTPAWLTGYMPEHFIGGGLTSRCIFLFAQKKAQLIPYPASHFGKENQELYGKLIHDLEQIAMLAGPVTMTPEAQAWGKEWYEHHWTSPPPSALNSDRYAGYLSRKQTHIHKLAIVLMAARRDELVLTLDDLQNAEQLVSSTEKQLPVVFDEVGKTSEGKAISELVQLVHRAGSIEVGELYRHLYRLMSYNVFKETLISAQRTGFVQVFQMGATTVVRAVDKT